MIKPYTRYKLEVSADLDLILYVDGAHIGYQVVVRVCGALPERHRNMCYWIRDRNDQRGVSIVEISCIPEIVGQLTSGFDTAKQSMAEAPRATRISHVS